MNPLEQRPNREIFIDQRPVNSVAGWRQFSAAALDEAGAGESR